MRIGEFKSVAEARVPLDGLVVLFGANSAGKTNVLEAISAFIRGDESAVRMDRRELFGLHDPGDGPWPGSWLLVELLHGDIAAHRDALWRQRLWSGDAGMPSGVDVDVALAAARQRASGEDRDVAELWIEETAGGAPGTADARRALAAAIAASRWYLVGYDATWLVVDPGEIRRRCTDAVDALSVFAPGELLVDLARHVATSDQRFVAFALGPGVEREYSPGGPISLPRLEWVRTEYDNIDREVRALVERLHVTMWHQPQGSPVRTSDGTMVEGFVALNDVLLDRLWAPEMDAESFIPDPWFEALDAKGARALEAEDECRANVWSRVRPTIQATAHVLGEYATTTAPSFVQELGTIEVEVLPPSLWAAAPDRVRVVFREHGAKPRDVRTLGSGVARWVAASVRVAALRLIDAKRELLDDDGRVAGGDEAAAFRVRAIEEAPETDRIRLVPKPALDCLILVDEPEAQLHPRAVQSVGEWLDQLSNIGLGVVLATHHPWFLGLERERLHLVYCDRPAGTTTLSDIGGDRLGSLDAVKDQFGLTRADLLQLTRLALFVEGPHDVAVLDGLFGEELRAAGVRLFPIHGTKNAMALVTSEIVAALGLRAGVLTDNTTTGPARGGGRPGPRGRERKSAEEQAIQRLLDEARAVGWSLDQFGLSRRDILQYIDDDVCRELAPAFPGWKRAAQEWRQSGSSPRFKEWVTRQYGLRLDRRSVARLVALMSERSQRPSELQRVVDEVIAAATQSRGTPAGT